MSEIRQGPTTGEWVIIARERTTRPSDFVHELVKRELTEFSPSCPFCPGNEAMTPDETLRYRQRDSQRIVMETGEFLAFHPFASQRPFETWIVPKKHQASFGNVSPEDLESLAQVLRLNLFKLYRGLNNPDFNYVIDTAPVGVSSGSLFFTHITILDYYIFKMNRTSSFGLRLAFFYQQQRSVTGVQDLGGHAAVLPAAKTRFPAG
jgi:galactose-1-phosphate uridylyltransferase